MTVLHVVLLAMLARCLDDEEVTEWELILLAEDLTLCVEIIVDLPADVAAEAGVVLLDVVFEAHLMLCQSPVSSEYSYSAHGL